MLRDLEKSATHSCVELANHVLNRLERNEENVSTALDDEVVFFHLRFWKRVEEFNDSIHDKKRV